MGYRYGERKYSEGLYSRWPDWWRDRMCGEEDWTTPVCDSPGWTAPVQMPGPWRPLVADAGGWTEVVLPAPLPPTPLPPQPEIEPHRGRRP